MEKTIDCRNHGFLLLHVLLLVIDSSGPAIINLLIRFFNTFGVPKPFISENGGAFVRDETQLFIRNWNIKWKFNHEAAPWMGAFFERLVISVKRYTCLFYKQRFFQLSLSIAYILNELSLKCCLSVYYYIRHCLTETRYIMYICLHA